MTEFTDIQEFGVAKAVALVRSAAGGIEAAASDPHPEAIHKMRVGIRRLQQAIRLFRQFLRQKGVDSVRRDLKALMDPAGELRNCDIALVLVRRAGGNPADLSARRLAALATLRTALDGVAGPELAQRWERRLGLPHEETVEA